jgi:glucose/arabinose dehydrogenase
MIKKIVLLAVFLIIGIGVFRYVITSKKENIILNPIPTQNINSTPSSTSAPLPLATVVFNNLDTPWSIVFLPDNKILTTERNGKVRLDGKQIATIEKSKEIGEGGLLGAAIHPDFSSNHFIYFYYTYAGSDQETKNKVVKMKLENDRLRDEQTIIDLIPGASNHNGGRIKFGPDKNLYITTGDAQNPPQAQDTNKLGGKILRVSDEGKPLTDNPFGNLVYSYGHRNPQGLAWDDKGQLYETEHGRSGIVSGLDELNKIEKGKNYGWPTIQGDETKSNMERSVINSGATTTWAPAGLAFYKGSFYFGGLRGQALYKVKVINGKPELNEYFKNEFGRIRDVVLGPDNMLYITTSNQDGRGIPKSEDDKVIRINPERL